MTLVIAHRGSSRHAQENTLPAFVRAIADGADYAELDVQCSSDGAPVVFHDTTLDRLTPLRGPLRKRSLAELRAVGIPTLEEVIEATRGRLPLMVELKSPHLYHRTGLVERTARLLSEDDVAVSFSSRALLEVARLAPQVRLLQHVGFGTSIARAARYAWAVGFHDPLVTARGLRRARAAGLRTTVYTVNDQARMEQLVALGVDGIFSDDPARLRRIVDGLGASRPPIHPRGGGSR